MAARYTAKNEMHCSQKKCCCLGKEWVCLRRRYGELIIEDLSKLNLTGQGKPDDLQDVAPVPFEAVAKKQHKWQVGGTLHR